MRPQGAHARGAGPICQPQEQGLFFRWKAQLTGARPDDLVSRGQTLLPCEVQHSAAITPLILYRAQMTVCPRLHRRHHDPCTALSCYVLTVETLNVAWYVCHQN